MRLHMLLHQTHRVLLTVASVAVVTGCASLTEPADPVVGVFVLSAIEGRPLPYLLRSSSLLTPESVTLVVADTLRFLADGRGEWRGTRLVREHPDSAATESLHLVTFRHRRVGTSIAVDSLDCGPDCVVSPFGSPFVYSGSVVLWLYPPGRWTYTRVDGVAP